MEGTLDISLSKTILLALLTTILFSGCATGPSLIEQNFVGKEYSGSINFRNKTVPLPAGVWRVIGSGKIGRDKALFEMVLIKVSENNVLNATITIHVDTITTTGRDNGYAKGKHFEKKDYHHVVVKNNEPGEAQDAWLVKHTRMSIRTKRKAWEEAYNYFKDNNYILPTTLIESIHRFTGKKIKRKFLFLRYCKNPESEGFEPPISTDMRTSDWSPLHINKYPRKVLYVQEFIKISEAYHKELKAGFSE